MKGSEDLGGGLAAVFSLENGFNLLNGQLASSGTLFNRMAYVGLSSKPIRDRHLGSPEHAVIRPVRKRLRPVDRG